MNDPNGAPPAEGVPAEGAPAASTDAGTASTAKTERPTVARDGSDPTSRLIRQLERLVEQTSQPAMRVPLLHRLARTWEERAGDPDRALAVLAEALEIKPRDRKTMAELERLAERSDRWEALANTWAHVADESDDRAAQVDLLAGLARLLSERLDRPDESLARWEDVLALDPTHEAALRAVATSWRETGRDDDLADVLPRLVAATETPLERAELLLELGALREAAGTVVEAIGAIENAGEILGDDLRVLEPLTRLYWSAERWDDLVGVLEHMATADPVRQHEHRLEAAIICEDKLQSGVRAAAIYEALLKARPGYEEALERLAAIYVEREDWPGVASVFERQLEAATSPGERAELCRRLAVLSEDAFQAPERAATWWMLLLGHTPDNTEAFHALRRIYESAERWSDLVSLLSARCQLPELATDERTALRLDIARLLRFRLDDAEGAIQVVETILDDVPDHEPSLRLLEELLRGSGDQKRLAELLDRKLAQLEDPSERAVVHLERAETYRDAGRTTEAVEAYRAALADAPGMVTALSHLVRTLAEDGHHEEVVTTLRSSIDGVEDPQVRADLLCELAAAYRRQGDTEGATDALERALELWPDHQRAARALAETFVADERWPEALPLLEILLPSLDTESEPAESAAFLRTIGRVVEALGQDDRAASFYGMADSLAPDNATTVAALARLAQKLGRAEEAGRRYEQLLGLSEAASSASDGTHDGLEARLALMERAMTADALDDAAAHADAVLAVEPDHPRALMALVAVADEAEDWPAAADLRRRLLAALEGDAGEALERHKLRMELGALLEERLDDLSGALEHFRAAAAEAPEARGPLLKVLEVQTALDRTEDALETLSLLCEHARRPEERSRYHFTAAQLLTALGREDEAVAQLLLTVEYDLERTDALADAQARLEAAGDQAGVAVALERVATVARERGSTHLARNLLRRLGEHHVKRTEDLDAAARAYREACALDPEDRRLRERLIEILVTAGRSDEAADELRSLLRLQPEQAVLWHGLLELFDRVGSEAGAHAALGVLVFTEQASLAERERHEARTLPRISEAPGRLAAEDVWRLADELAVRSPIAQLMHILYENLGDALEAHSLKDEGLRKGDELEPTQDLLFLRTLRVAGAALGVPLPTVYFEQRGRGFRVLPISPPAFAIGPGLLKGRTEPELSFVIGKGLVYLQPAFAMAGIFAPATLRALVSCARTWATPENAPPSVDSTRRRRVDAVVKTLDRRLSDENRERVRQLVPRCDESDLVPWLVSVARLANRVGLLCCSDIPTASHLCARPITTVEPPLDGAEAIMDLALVSVSRAYLELHARLWPTEG